MHPLPTRSPGGLTSPTERPAVLRLDPGTVQETDGAGCPETPLRLSVVVESWTTSGARVSSWQGLQETRHFCHARKSTALGCSDCFSASPKALSSVCPQEFPSNLVQQPSLPFGINYSQGILAYKQRGNPFQRLASYVNVAFRRCVFVELEMTWVTTLWREWVC